MKIPCRHLLDQINGMHWRDVPSASRDAFSFVSLLLCRLFVDRAEKRDELYSILDAALLLGSDFAYDDIQRQLSALDAALKIYEPRLPSPVPSKIRTVSPRLRRVVLATSSLDPVPVEDTPTLERFLDIYMTAGRPVLLRGCAAHWPAMHGPRAWSNLDYIKHGMRGVLAVRLSFL